MFPVLLLLALGTLSTDMGLPMNNSGLLAAVSSSMCTRLILATRKWNNGTVEHSAQSLVELDFRSPVVFCVPTLPTEAGAKDIESEEIESREPESV
ncbi:hypothetical protein FRC12_011572 [Ceratobasidium sp. 428]|nr:hypothetical protein FRC12_011572 [Ceratobasidium sp. 428]